MPEPTTLTQLVLQGGAIAVLVFMVVGLMQGWIVPGHVYRDCRDQGTRLLRERDQAVTELQQYMLIGRQASQTLDPAAVSRMVAIALKEAQR